MDQGQELFLGYILERVQEDKVEEAKALFLENFKKLTEGNFTQEDIVMLIPKAMALLKPDKVEEVLAVMNEFAGDLKK
ncbi:hypothetical protein KQI88_03900 [Alkaliphilus sp. MSJ-5]|uniref:Uncharacterized protein n=1 Tax=Alkaliphilus flagellatus TaxID=2841507 RepID=A0ABS6FZS0_9FIRM|nr:hypothetical protein [Alkaliphilus flagellatus]MBU5675554.1 hypothetical protein [Alkaliphilus flagellatus]